jgi:hypothetical protein
VVEAAAASAGAAAEEDDERDDDDHDDDYRDQLAAPEARTVVVGAGLRQGLPAAPALARER